MTTGIITQVSDFLSLSEADVKMMAREAPKSYRRYFVDKRNGGKRPIFHPSKATKALQYALTEIVFSRLPVHETALAYRPGIRSPLLRNATLHAGLPYTVRIDCRDFFPSIAPQDLERVLRNSSYFAAMQNDDLEFIHSACFVRYSGGLLGLAIGAPTSPIISNVVMYNLDALILGLAKRISGRSVYTRYADDIVFSTDIKGGSGKFVAQIQKLFERTTSPKLQINEEKTVFSSRASRRKITGLTVCPNGTISIGRKAKRYIRGLIFSFENEKLPDDKKASLAGYLAYILDVEPDLYNRLAIKYTGELLRKIRQA